MPIIWPPFVPKGTTSVYSIRFTQSEDAFQAPPRDIRWPWGCEVVRPFLDRSGSHTMALYPLPLEHCTYRDALERGAELLECYATGMQYRNFTMFDTEYLCAVFMMAWYLADDDASIMRLLVEYDDLCMQRVHVAVWANVAFIRNMWALEALLSREVFNKYLDNYYCFVSDLRTVGVHLHTTSHPVEHGSRSAGDGDGVPRSGKRPCVGPTPGLRMDVLRELPDR